KDRLAERGRFLLHTTRIGEHQPAMRHERHEVTVALGCDELDVWQATQQPVDVQHYVGIEVNRVNETIVREALGQGRDGLAELLNALAKVLAAMPSDKDRTHLRPVSPYKQA